MIFQYILFIFVTLASFLFFSCGDDIGTGVEGTITFSGSASSTKAKLTTSFFWHDPTDIQTNRLILIATNIGTTCEDASDGIIDEGRYPKNNLVLFLSNESPGTYLATKEPQESGYFFGGGFVHIESDTSHEDIDIDSGTFDLSTITETELTGSVNVYFADNKGGTGHLSGRIFSLTCPLQK